MTAALKYAKPFRLYSKENLQTIRELSCMVCMADPPSDPEHYKTQGAGGDDSLENLISLCRECHTERHKVGVATFYGPVKRHMIDQRRVRWGLPKVKWGK